ncbi:MAG: hypothetical protein WA733_21805 [Methylocystis sp.]
MSDAQSNPRDVNETSTGGAPRDENVGNGADHGGNGAAHDVPNYPDSLDALKERPVWVFWQYASVDGRTTKVPYSPISGGLAQSDNPRGWSDWYVANRFAKKNSNQLGIVLADIGDGLHLAGIDLDTCRDRKTGKLQPFAEDIVKRFASYTEVSPSKTGVKIFFLYRLADKDELNRLFDSAKDGKEHHGRQFKNAGGEHPPSIEIYKSHRYFTVTNEQYGNYAKLRIVPVEDVRWLIETAGPAFKGRTTASSSSSGAYRGSTNRANDDSRSAKAFREGARLKAAGKTYEEMRDALLNHADPDIQAWAHEKGEKSGEREMHRIYDRAKDALPDGCELEHFHAYMPNHDYIHIPTTMHWPASSVNARLYPVPLFKEDGTPVLDKKGNQKTIAASVYLDRTRAVEQLIWSPDDPMLVEDRYLVEGSGWVDHIGGRGFNSYRPPTIKHGNPRKAGPWLKLMRKLYHGDARHIIDYMAFKVQNPGKKINHGVLMIGPPGVGKDSSLQPLVQAVGPWNFKEIKPSDMFETFNPFVKAVILRISEVHDLGDVSRFAFYERTKVYMAAPPDVISCNDKHLRRINVVNVMGIFMTSNHETDGVYLPADDRRTYVASSSAKLEDFAKDYFDKLWGWYDNGGFEHVAAYLAQRDISKFNPKAPPKKTDAFWRIVDANRSTEEGELDGVIERMGNPMALTLIGLIENTIHNESLFNWLKDRKNRKSVSHRLAACEYEPLRNPDTRNKMWKIEGNYQVIYAKKGLSPREQMEAAADLIKNGNPRPSFAGKYEDGTPAKGNGAGNAPKDDGAATTAADEDDYDKPD